MAFITPELIAKISPLQNIVWQNVTQSASAASGTQLNFSEPETASVPLAELYSTLGSPMMVIQFAFAHMPENTQAVLLDEETAAKLATEILGETHQSVDENTVADIRSTLEAIVQGLCLAIGQIRNDTIVASGMTIRHQMFSFPHNLQRQEQLCRTTVKLSAATEIGQVIWLLDKDAVLYIAGVEDAAEAGSPFPQVNHGEGQEGRAGKHSAADDMNGLELLLDVPLEISVELGRVKMLVKDVVELGTGSIVEIDKAAGEPVDVMVNGKLVARGEVVVIEDNFGVRVTEILNPYDRLKNLGDAA